MLTSVSVHLVLLGALVGGAPALSDNRGKIEGTKWSSLPGTVKGQNLPGGVLKLDFAKGGKLVYRAGMKTMTGTYSLRVRDRVALKLDEKLAGVRSHTEKVVVDGDRLTMTDSDGTTLTFERVEN